MEGAEGLAFFAPKKGFALLKIRKRLKGVFATYECGNSGDWGLTIFHQEISGNEMRIFLWIFHGISRAL